MAYEDSELERYVEDKAIKELLLAMKDAQDRIMELEELIIALGNEVIELRNKKAINYTILPPGPNETKPNIGPMRVFKNKRITRGKYK